MKKMNLKQIALGLWLVILPMVGMAQIDTVSDLPEDQKIAGLATYWSEAKYNFAYFDQTNVDWDQAFQEFIPRVKNTKSTWEYYLVMKEFNALLSDGHTDINFPKSLFKAAFYDPVKFVLLNDAYYITNIRKTDRKKIPLGSELVKIEGEPAAIWLENNIGPYIGGSTEIERKNDFVRRLYYAIPDTNLHLTMEFRTPRGRTKTYEYRYRAKDSEWLKAEDPKERYEFEMMGDIAYVALNTFGYSEVVERFEQDMPKIKEANGVIIDLRKNGGGNSNFATSILKHFTSADTLVGSAWKTRQHQSSFKAWGWYFRRNNPDFNREDGDEWERKILSILENDYWYDGGTSKRVNDSKKEFKDMPLVVLSSHKTASAAEDFLVYLRQLPDRNVKVIGTPTFGSTGQPLPVVLPGDAKARICSKRDTFADGTDFVGVGIIPDLHMEPTIKDLIKGRDPILKEALKLVK